jgi:hypothetical protein
MRKLFLTFAVLALSAVCFASATLDQQTANASGSTTSSTLGFTASTATTTFPVATQAADLLVGVVWISATASTTISSIAPTSITAVGQTLSFTFGQNCSNWNATLSNGGCALFYVANAPSVANTTTFSASASMSGAGSCGGCTLKVEVAIYAFTGVVTSSVVDTNEFGHETTTSTPWSGFNLTANHLDMAVIVYSSNGSNLSAGTCCTLGMNASVATTGQMQYTLSIPVGTSNPQFSGGTAPVWNGGYLTFKLATPSAVPRHRGWVN